MTILRQTMGDDVSGACGQLVLEVEKKGGMLQYFFYYFCIFDLCLVLVSNSNCSSADIEDLVKQSIVNSNSTSSGVSKGFFSSCLMK